MQAKNLVWTPLNEKENGKRAASQDEAAGYTCGLVLLLTYCFGCLVLLRSTFILFVILAHISEDASASAFTFLLCPPPRIHHCHILLNNTLHFDPPFGKLWAEECELSSKGREHRRTANTHHAHTADTAKNSYLSLFLFALLHRFISLGQIVHPSTLTRTLALNHADITPTQAITTPSSFSFSLAQSSLLLLRHTLPPPSPPHCHLPLKKSKEPTGINC